MNKFSIIIIILCFTLVLIPMPFGCSSPPLVRVGTLRVIDSLPLSLARHKPIFAENNLLVEAVYFENPAALRSALLNGNVEAVITDLISALLLNAREERAKIVRIALRASPSRPMFTLVTASKHPSENIRIAVSNEAVDKYVSSRLLKAAGISKWTEIEVSGPQNGLEKMERGEVSAVLLTEPFVSMAVKKGAQVFLDDRSLMVGQTVVVFSQRMAREKPALIRRFLRAYEQAIRELNARPQFYLSLAGDLVRPPSEESADLAIPVFPFPGEVPTESDIESANTWRLEKKIGGQPIPYRRAVNGGFLWDPYQFKPAACCGL
jgi:NitT/TauT family transport system substrate-binding protein